MARKTKKIITDVGTYQDTHGNEKRSWRTVGFLLDNGSFKLELIPFTPDWSGWFRLVDLDDNKQPQQRQSPNYASQDYDGTPF